MWLSSGRRAVADRALRATEQFADDFLTDLEGRQGLPVGNVYFAGEHTDLFYEWQGFMEGAANSGIRAAGEILADFG